MSFSRNRNARWQRRLRQLAQMRAAKARKRWENPPPEPESRFGPWFPLELGLRDKRTGEIAWVDFRSVRDAAKRLSVVKRFYV